jgi:hypothetical protein
VIVADFFRALVCVLVLRLATGDAAGSDTSAKSSAEIAATKKLLRRCGVPIETFERLQSELGHIDAKSFIYPWPDLEEAVAKAPGHTLLLVGYGSLMNRDSAARTIKGNPIPGNPPVLALGARRVFNYLIPQRRLKSYGKVCDKRERAALNVDYTRSPSHALNGRLLAVKVSDLAALREREFGYDLRPVPCVRWGNWDAAPFVAYVLVAPAGVPAGKKVIDNNALPNPAYARLCRAGARAVSEDFLRLYLHTTYLADRKTTLAEWERLRPELTMN